jgi:hypothetical protein
LRISKHIFATPNEHQKGSYVDHAAGADGMASLVPNDSEIMNTFKNNCAVNNKPERKRKNLIRFDVEQEMASME